jgi:hypothetical protein
LQKNGEYRPTSREVKSDNSSEQIKSHSFGKSQGVPSKLYLRVPSLTSEKFVRAKNLVEIFEGSVSVIFYDTEAKSYNPSGLGFDATDYTVGELKKLLGDDNVVLK